jgi:anti-anti-sigma factor
MAFEVKKKKDFTLITLQSEKLDSNIAPLLKSELVVINSEGEKNIIMDLSSARYCDSSGLSAILVGNRLCKNAGGNLIICGLKDAVSKLITISQLDSILSIAPDSGQAEKQLETSPVID